MKKQFKNLNELYNTGVGYFWKYGRYCPEYQLDFISKMPMLILKLENKNTILAKGLKNINRIMQLENLEVE